MDAVKIGSEGSGKGGGVADGDKQDQTALNYAAGEARAGRHAAAIS